MKKILLGISDIKIVYNLDRNNYIQTMFFFSFEEK